jgi:hypothetical protein
MTFLIGEVFDKLKGLTPAQQVEHLRYVCKTSPGAVQSLCTLLQAAYHPEVKFVLPEGAPPFKRTHVPIGEHDVSLYNVVRKLGLWCDGTAILGSNVQPRPGLKASIRENTFIDLLQALPDVEIDFLLAAKDKQMKETYGVDVRTIAEVFPELDLGPLPDGAVSTETPKKKRVSGKRRKGARKKPLRKMRAYVVLDTPPVVS